jgi:aspartyl-tRNA(Asn)/glutamyl-tRNA(Gln) amidotransferase subunit A
MKHGSGAAGDDRSLLHARERVAAIPDAARILAHRFEVAGAPDGPLQGTAYLTKANIAVRDKPLDCCSRILEGYRSPFDATVTRRLREAGATCLGATNMDEFAMGSSGETSILGAPEHPWLSGRVCGGSSSGAAAAVARGAVPFALGSDTGGSVRQPAAWCGVVGLKPTWGRVSRHGLVAHASSLDTIGILAGTVSDAREVLGLIEGVDGLDATLREWPEEDPAPLLRTVVLPRLAEGAVAPAVAASLEDVASRLEREGVKVSRVDLPSLDAALAAYVVIAAAETASNLARYDGSIYGRRVEAPTYEESVRATRSEGLGTEVKLRILLGTEVLRQGHTARAIARARAVVRRLADEFTQVVPADAVCLMPTVPRPAIGRGAHAGDPVAMRSLDRFTVPANLLGLPAVAVPSGEDDEGAPLSVQCMAHRGRDGLALAGAAAIEELLDIPGLRARRWRPRMVEGR